MGYSRHKDKAGKTHELFRKLTVAVFLIGVNSKNSRPLEARSVAAASTASTAGHWRPGPWPHRAGQQQCRAACTVVAVIPVSFGT